MAKGIGIPGSQQQMEGSGEKMACQTAVKGLLWRSKPGVIKHRPQTADCIYVRSLCQMPREGPVLATTTRLGCSCASHKH